jgi:hypothetical protein
MHIDFLFDICLGILLTIPQLKAAKGQRLAKLTLDFLHIICDEEKFTRYSTHMSLRTKFALMLSLPPYQGREKLPRDTRLAQQAQRCSSCQQPI